MKRAAAVGAMVIGLALGAASGALAADRGNHQAIWDGLVAEHGTIDSGSAWGEHNSVAAPEYVNPSLGGGPGISPGVHEQKENGPGFAGSGNAPGLNK